MIVTSTLGQGSQFVFILPVSAPYGDVEKSSLLVAEQEPIVVNPTLQPATALHLALPSIADVMPPPPPAEELKVLLDMAHKGELPRLRSRVMQVSKLSARYQPFGDLVIALIDQYDEDTLHATLQQYAELIHE